MIYRMRNFADETKKTYRTISELSEFLGALVARLESRGHSLGRGKITQEFIFNSWFCILMRLSPEDQEAYVIEGAQIMNDLLRRDRPPGLDLAALPPSGQGVPARQPPGPLPEVRPGASAVGVKKPKRGA